MEKAKKKITVIECSACNFPLLSMSSIYRFFSSIAKNKLTQSIAVDHYEPILSITNDLADWATEQLSNNFNLSFERDNIICANCSSKVGIVLREEEGTGFLIEKKVNEYATNNEVAEEISCLVNVDESYFNKLDSLLRVMKVEMLEEALEIGAKYQLCFNSVVELKASCEEDTL